MGLKIVQPAQENNCLDSIPPDFLSQRGGQATLGFPSRLLRAPGEPQVRRQKGLPRAPGLPAVTRRGRHRPGHGGRVAGRWGGPQSREAARVWRALGARGPGPRGSCRRRQAAGSGGDAQPRPPGLGTGSGLAFCRVIAGEGASSLMSGLQGGFVAASPGLRESASRGPEVTQLAQGRAGRDRRAAVGRGGGGGFEPGRVPAGRTRRWPVVPEPAAWAWLPFLPPLNALSP